MWSTELAHVVGYRDTYLLLHNNPDLYRVLLSDEDKRHMLERGILPPAPSYARKVLTAVTARTAYKQFGWRIVLAGRPGIDDYWESSHTERVFTDENWAF
jgi:chromatin structure-remodeling complex protein RSC7